MSNETNPPKILELAPPELTIPLKVTYAGRTYRVRHFLRPPGPADWLVYEAALEMAVEELPPPPGADSNEPCFRIQMRSTDAARELWDRLAARVEGYHLPSAYPAPFSGDLPSAPGASEHVAPPPSEGTAGRPAPRSPQGAGVGRAGDTPESDWRALIPLAHKEAAVRALTLVAPAPPLSYSTDNDSTNNHFPLLAEEIPIVLEAAVAGVAYPRLVHRFRPPSVEAERAYRRLMAETLIIRGSRIPRTLIPSRLPALTRLYDQLVLSVSGYTLNGRPLAGPQDIARAMDAWHKRVAVQTLFGDVAENLPPGATAQEDLSNIPSELPQ